MGTPDGPLIQGVRRSSELYDIPVNELAKSAGPFKLPYRYDVLFEPGAGFVQPEKAILCHAGLALSSGAELRTNETVLGWSSKNGIINVQTNSGSYTGKKLVITAGAWAPGLLPELKETLEISRQLVAWVKPKRPEAFGQDAFTCWTLEATGQEGIFYGFPMLDPTTFGPPKGLKIGYHHPARFISDPATLDRSALAGEIEELKSFMTNFMPEVYDGLYDSKICMYTNTADSNFIIDTLPENENVIIATGFSGHGYKFASLVGEILAELASTGTSKEPIDFLSMNGIN